jgi:pilus assembly protein CpaB
MKPKTLMLMGVAIACGLGASYMTSRLLAERQSDDEPKVTVLVARRALNMGETIKLPEELFQEKKFTRGEEPAGAIENIDLLKNRVLKRPLRPGDYVTAEDLFGNDDKDGMNFLVPKDHRAVGVRVNTESGVFGFACTPLSRVDVVGTFRRADDKATFTKILLQNVLVLAADDKTRRGEDGKPMPSTVVTLALKPEDALKVRLAGEMGSLSLMLRKINDAQYADNTMMNFEELKNGISAHGDETPIDTKPPVEVAKLPEPPKAPAATTKPDGPALTETAKPSVHQHVLTVVEGGRTRYVVYWLNEAGEVVDGDTSTETAHPPRPTDATIEQKK